MNVVNVGVAELQVGETPIIFKTILGSCIGIALYDAKLCVGGLAHVMLPCARNGKGAKNPAKFMNTAVPALVNQLVRRHRSAQRSLKAKIIGGATMFTHRKSTHPTLDIGNNNIKAVRMCLRSLRIPIVAEDVGADYGRRIEFHLDSGLVRVTGQGRTTIEL